MERGRAKSRPLIVHLVSCCICAVLLGFILSQMTIKSDAIVTAMDQLFLVLYLFLTLGTYICALVVANRLFYFSTREVIPGLAVVSVVGTSLPFVVNTIHIWLRYRVDVAWLIPHSFETLLLLNLIML